MTMLRVLLLSALLAASTVFIGWWSVPLLTACYAAIRRDLTSPRDAAAAAVLAWGGLLARLAPAPAFPRLLRELAEIFGMPGLLLALISLLFVTGLAWSAARSVIGLAVNRKSVAARVNAR